jgi:hypothetical protein
MPGLRGNKLDTELCIIFPARVYISATKPKGEVYLKNLYGPVDLVLVLPASFCFIITQSPSLKIIRTPNYSYPCREAYSRYYL